MHTYILLILVCLLNLVVCEAKSNEPVKEISLLSYVLLALKQSDEAMYIDEEAEIVGLQLDNVKFDYQFQWLPSIALRNSPQGRLETYGITASKKFEFGSTVSISTQYEKFNSNVTNNVTKSPTISMAFEQDLFRNWGKDMGRYSLSIAELNSDKELWRLIGRKQSLLKISISNYFSALLLEQKLTLKQENVNRANNNLEVTKSRFSLGLVSKLDLYRAERALLHVQDAYNVAKRQFSKSIRNLQAFINMPTSIILKLSPVNQFNNGFSNMDNSIAFRARVDWQQQLIQQKINDIQLTRAEKNLLPDVKLRLTAKKYVDTFENEYGYSNEELDWNVGLSYNTPFNLTREKNELSRKKVYKQRFLRNKVNLKRVINESIIDATEDVVLIKEQRDILLQISEQAELAVELSTIRFNRGLSSNLDLVETESELQKVKLDLLENQIEYNQSLVELAQQLGILDTAWLERVSEDSMSTIIQK